MLIQTGLPEVMQELLSLEDGEKQYQLALKTVEKSFERPRGRASGEKSFEAEKGEKESRSQRTRYGGLFKDVEEKKG